MSKVKFGFNGLTVSEQIERSRLIIGAMTGNASYLTPNPTLPTMTNATDDLETAYNASRGRDKDEVAIMRLRRKELLFLISQLGAYVQQASEGDEEIILSSGFDVRDSNTPHPVFAGAVSNLRLSDGSSSGKIKVRWDAADDAVNYIIESSFTIDFSNAEGKGITTKTQKEIGEFTPGVKVWIKVIPVGRELPGPASEPISIIVR